LIADDLLLLKKALIFSLRKAIQKGYDNIYIGHAAVDCLNRLIKKIDLSLLSKYFAFVIPGLSGNSLLKPQDMNCL